MNIIQKAIFNGKHICKDSRIVRNSTWGRFRKEAKGKKIVLFGGTRACDFFLEKYGSEYHVTAVLDNDKKKAGKCYSNFSEINLANGYKELLIKAPEELDRDVIDKAVVVITSTNYYEEIAEQLEQMGVLDYYVLLLMEARMYRYISCKMKRSFINKKAALEQKARIYVQKKTGLNEAALQEVKRFYYYRRFPIQKNKIVFKTFGKYMDHGKYIAEEILRQNLPYDLVWLIDDGEEVRLPDGIRTVNPKDQETFCYELATAKLWISDVEMPHTVRKRRGQIYIQTKHWAGVTLKKFYLDAQSLLADIPRVRNWRKDFHSIDYMITGSDFDTETCRRGFEFKKKVWQVGSPRSDILFHSENVREKVYQYCGCSRDKQFLLYAPTYRFDQVDGRNKMEVRSIDLNYREVLDALEYKFGGDWKILLRLHPAVAKYSKDMELPQGVIDVSAYDDVQELVAVSEVMISDYSSVMFESAFIKRPVFLFTTDYQEYVKKEYELLIEISDLPFPRAENNEELCQLIRNFDQEKYEESVGKFLDKYGVKEDGNASKRVVEHIKGLMHL